jgi:hypothetical protein
VKYALANHFEHPLSVSLPEEAVTGHVDRRPALEFASPDPWHPCRAGISDQSFPRTTGTPGTPMLMARSGHTSVRSLVK